MQPLNPRSDPAPSRWSYRFQRWMLTPFFRRTLRLGLPLLILGTAILMYAADEKRQEKFMLAVAGIREQIVMRPEFQVKLLSFDGTSENVEAEIREIFPYDFPASSFDLDLEEVRYAIEALPAVASARIRIQHGGILKATIKEREPVALWRNETGLHIIDLEGVPIRRIESRAAFPQLPVLAGAGVDEQVSEALALIKAAEPIANRVRGLVRMGQRRWDVVLDRDQRIMLPGQSPVRALERVIFLDHAKDLLSRDVVTVDMRLGERPTLRMSKAAQEQWWRLAKLTTEAGQK